MALLVLWCACGGTNEPQQTSGCGDETYVPAIRETELGEFPELDVYATRYDDDREIRFAIDFNERGPSQEYLHPMLDQDGVYYCPSFRPSFNSTFAGVNASTKRDSAWHCTEVGQECTSLVLVFELEDGADPDEAQLVLSDETTLTRDFGDLLAARTVTPPGPWIFHVGESVAFEWSPPGDLARSSNVTVDHLDNMTIDGDTIAGTFATDAQVELSFTVDHQVGEHATFKTILQRVATILP